MNEPKKIGALAVKAIATTYRQYEFRSRLEAKWAAFFDLCKWPWSYEPVDYNGWIPDFAIGEHPVLVEVKPFFREEEFTEAKAKVMASGFKGSVLLLGSDPAWIANTVESYGSAPVFGWHFFHVGCRDGECIWSSEDLHFGITEGNDKPGLCAMDGAWRNQIWDFPSHPAQPKDRTTIRGKWARVNLMMHDQEYELVQRWATACNISKWVPTRNTNNA